MDIDSMEPGPELDALVAEKVMGWKLEMWPPLEREYAIEQRPYWTGHEEVETPDDWRPSEEIRYAWRVVEALAAKRRILIWPEIAPAGNYGIVVKQAVLCELYREWREKILFTVVCDSAPLGICRAAVKVVSGLPWA